MEGGSQRVLSLIFSDKIPNNLLIPHSSSVWLSLLLSHSHCTRAHTQAHTQRYRLAHKLCAVSRVPWQSITVVGTAQVLCMRKNASKNKHENVNVTHKEPHHARSTVSSECCFPLSGIKCQSSKTGLQAVTINFRRLSWSQFFLKPGETFVVF